jgi:hypothetical protein
VRTGPYTAVRLVRQAISRETRAHLLFRNPFHDLKNHLSGVRTSVTLSAFQLAVALCP